MNTTRTLLFLLPFAVALTVSGCGSDTPPATTGEGNSFADTAISDALESDAGDAADVQNAPDSSEKSDTGPTSADDTEAAADTQITADVGVSDCANGCDDGNDCTTDACIGGSCSHVPSSEPCDDGLACTGGDTCSLGVCEGKKLFWTQTFGGVDEDVGRDAVRLSDGGLVVAGHTKSKGAGDRDAWLVKIDVFGELVWDKTFGAPKNQAAYAVAVNKDAATAAGAWLESTQSRSRGWLQTVDKDGNALASHLFKVDELSEANAISVGATLNKPTTRMHVAGHLETVEGDITLAIAQVDPATLQPLWVKHLGKTGFDAAWDIGQLYNGSIAVVGDTAPGGSGPHVWLQELSDKNDVTWQQTYHSDGEDTGWALLLHPDPVLQNKGFTIAGSRKAPGEKVRSAWLMRADATGKTTWQTLLKAVGGAVAYDVAGGGNGGYVLVGQAAKSAGKQRAVMWATDDKGVQTWQTTAGGDGGSARGVLVWSDAYGMVGQDGSGKNAQLLVVRLSKQGKLTCP